MKLEFGLDIGLWVERLGEVMRTALGFSLGAFSVSVVLMGASIGDPVFVEGIASLSTLTIALSRFACIALGLSAAYSSSLAESQAATRMARRSK